MTSRSDVAPNTLPVTVEEDAVRVQYTDGRSAVYRGPPETVSGAVTCRPGKDVHVLVADPDAGEGVMVYVNDRKTVDEILESTGVGRIVLEPGEEHELFPGVTARAEGYSVAVEADPGTAGGRVFVFEEDEFGERAVEIVA